ncbi:hypothetical protein E2C01_025062 [Portunus trituberculatus]|uniref:Uncharacterized protein n=1 Tax=Portunus trituberculatus TaxID=210409 RepID=A0A5B7EEE3_PORTR|nr:hypothetical protein [Portunus trituberculatus]
MKVMRVQQARYFFISSKEVGLPITVSTARYCRTNGRLTTKNECRVPGSDGSGVAFLVELKDKELTLASAGVEEKSLDDNARTSVDGSSLVREVEVEWEICYGEAHTEGGSSAATSQCCEAHARILSETPVF